MLLAVDIGNTNIVIGGYQEGKWVHQWRLETKPEKKTGEYSRLIGGLLKEANVSYKDLNKVIVGSVVPQLTETIGDVFEHQVHSRLIILNGSLDTGISLGSADPSSVGADLIADAAGAYHRFGATCIIVDFGTATTVMVVKDPGLLVGGAICAGLKVTHDALVEKTALLPSVPLEVPSGAIGTGTVEAMQSGIVLGHICMVEGLIDRMKKVLGDVKVIATGGLATTLAVHSNYFDAVDPLLTLNGLRIIAERQS